jgi:hypothetical protein
MDQNAAESSEGTLWSRILASTDRNSARGSGASDHAGSSRRIVVLGETTLRLLQDRLATDTARPSRCMQAITTLANRP